MMARPLVPGVPSSMNLRRPIGEMLSLRSGLHVSDQVEGTVLFPRGRVWRHAGQAVLELISDLVHDFHRGLHPTAIAHGLDHGRWDHVVVQDDGVAKFDVLVCAKPFSPPEVETDRNQVREREILGLGKSCRREHRPNRPGFESKHGRLAVACSFGKQDAPKPVRNAA